MLTIREAYHTYFKEKFIQEQNKILQQLNLAIQEIQNEYLIHELLKKAAKILNHLLPTFCQCFFHEQDNQYTIIEQNQELSQELKQQFIKNLPVIKKEKFYYQALYLEPFKKIQYLLWINLGNQFYWGMITEPFIENFVLEFLNLFTENLKTHLEKCLLFENLNAKIEEIQIQSDIIQEQNKDILHSLYYARRIQNATLDPLTPESLPIHFSYIYEPKDIISGDFYWFKTLEDTVLFALGDCTGHGVPGAMLATLSISLLNQITGEIIKNYNLHAPSLTAQYFLNEFAKQFSESLNRTADYHAKDGLELAILILHLPTQSLQFAGANMDLWMIRNQEISVIEGCKQSIEGWNFHFKAYKNHAFTLQPNDFLVLFTDGIPHQFGGEQNKKFGYKKLREFFTQYFKPEASPNQLNKLNMESKEWQGNHPQTDDKTCFVFKI